jgi:alpha-L-rhamnosidase
VLSKAVRAATLSVTARGVFEAYLNGKRIGNDEFAPGWTDFKKRIQFMTYDVTALLQDGANALGMVIADGWCCGNLTTLRRRNVFHPHPEALLLLDVEFTDGTHQFIESGSDWRAATGPILASDIYDGETYDARLEMPGWNKPGFDDSTWIPAATGELARETQALLIQKISPPVHVVEELKPVAILNPRKDVFIWDFGQNITGKMRVKLRGWAGRLYTFTFAEMLDSDGMLYNLNYRGARVTDYFICGEGMIEDGFGVYEPHFTFHGFRYLRIDGFQFADTKFEDVEATALVMHTDLPIGSKFWCGNENVNRLFLNILWGQRGNFLEIPTDCPQRDERLGWTGDANIFCGTALCNMDADSFFRKWLADVRDAQYEDGAIPCLAPDCLPGGIRVGQAAWADAIVMVPWRVYRDCGDRKILADNYDAMEKWMHWQCANAKDLIRQGPQLADWLTPDPLKCPDEFVATVFFAITARIMARVADLLGHPGRAEYYQELRTRIEAAVIRDYVDSEGMPTICNQTACLLMLVAGIGKNRALLAAKLQALIQANGNRLATGFIGTALLNLALADNGLDNVAVDLLLQTECPSWLFSVLQGATTVWERWDSYTREKGFGDVTMNSFNHYAYGAVGEWMMTRLAGIDCDFERGGLVFDARFDARLRECRARRETVFGTATSHWTLADGSWHWDFTVPANAPAVVVISRQGALLDNIPVKRGIYSVLPGTHTVAVAESP